MGLCATFLFAQQYDLVVSGGRVMDPETNLDAIRNIGVTGNRIAAISTSPLRGRDVVDAKGLVVAPGFIDLHSHGQTPENYRLKAYDGVTTALELEIGVAPIPAWYASREGKALINFGASAGYVPACMAAMHDTGALLPRDEAVNRRPNENESRRIFESVRTGLEQGGVGVGFGLEYVPKAPHKDVLDVFELAAKRGVPCFVHLRHQGLGDIASAEAAEMPGRVGQGHRLGHSGLHAPSRAVDLAAATKRRTLSGSLVPGRASTPEFTSTA